MRAVYYTSTGLAHEVLRSGEVPQPTPGAGEVLVKLQFSGVNPGDIKKRQDWAGFGMSAPLVIPHSDGAGVITAVGNGVEPSRRGQRVWVWGAQSYRPWGTAAQFVAIPQSLAVELPETVSAELGACLGIPGITAHRCVFADGPVEGLTVVVHGVLGAVGLIAAALARRGGARVIGTVRRSSDLAEAEGLADAIVALDDDPATKIKALAPSGVDRIIEVSLSDNVALDLDLAAVGATIAAYAAGADPVELPFWGLLFKNVTLRMLGSDDFDTESRQAAIDDLTAAAAEGALPIRIADPLPLEQCAEAHRRVEAGSRQRVLLRLPQ